MNHIKSIGFYLAALCFFVSTMLAPTLAYESENMTGDEKAGIEITEEDREIIKNLELIESVDWLMRIDLELLENLEIFITNS